MITLIGEISLLPGVEKGGKETELRETLILQELINQLINIKSY